MKPLIHAFQLFDNFYVFDANANSILSVTETQWKLAKEIEEGIISEKSRSLIESFLKLRTSKNMMHLENSISGIYKVINNVPVIGYLKANTNGAGSLAKNMSRNSLMISSGTTTYSASSSLNIFNNK